MCTCNCQAALSAAALASAIVGPLARSHVAFALPALEAPARSERTLQDVTVVNPARDRREHVDVAIKGGAIASIESTREPHERPAAFVLPGLIDMHVHSPILPTDAELFHTLYLLHGVTSVRNLGDRNQSFDRKRALAAGTRGGPRTFACGTHLDGPPGSLVAKVLKTPDVARAAVRQLVAAGADCIKVFPNLDAATYQAIWEEAHAAGLPVVGHMVNALGIEQARMDDVQHLTGIPDGPSPGFDPGGFERWARTWDTVDEARIDAVVAAAQRDGGAHTPTLVGPAYQAWVGRPDAPVRPRGDLMPAWYRALWGRAFYSDRPNAREAASRMLARQLDVVRRLHAAGVPVFAGTDVFVDYVVPGAALHDELALFVRAGFTPAEALAAATSVPARALRVTGLGIVAEGNPADLAIFREDPTVALAHLDSLESVIVDGRYYRQDRLAALHAQQIEAAASFLYRVQGATAGWLVRRLLAH
jgi:imidazolonepropionase-like amidohydrolase